MLNAKMNPLGPPKMKLARLLYFSLCPLAFSLALASARGQTIEFLPGAPSVYENGTNIAIVVTRIPANGISTVDFMTMDGTAMEGFDYYGTNGTLTFNDGE